MLRIVRVASRLFLATCIIAVWEQAASHDQLLANLSHATDAQGTITAKLERLSAASTFHLSVERTDQLQYSNNDKAALFRKYCCLPFKGRPAASEDAKE